MYNTLSNALTLAVKDYGYFSNWEVVTNVDFTDKYIEPYIKIQDYCSRKTPYAGTRCSYHTNNLNNEINNTFMGSDRNVFMLTDGTVIGIQKMGSSSANLYVDINGPKKPNIFGKDVFWFRYILTDKIGIVPYCGGAPFDNEWAIYSSITQETQGCKKGSGGTACGCVIMKNNWQVPTIEEYLSMCKGSCTSADYPW